MPYQNLGTAQYPNVPTSSGSTQQPAQRSGLRSGGSIRWMGPQNDRANATAQFKAQNMALDQEKKLLEIERYNQELAIQKRAAEREEEKMHFERLERTGKTLADVTKFGLDFLKQNPNASADEYQTIMTPLVKNVLFKDSESAQKNATYTKAFLEQQQNAAVGALKRGGTPVPVMSQQQALQAGQVSPDTKIIDQSAQETQVTPADVKALTQAQNPIQAALGSVFPPLQSSDVQAAKKALVEQVQQKIKHLGGSTATPPAPKGQRTLADLIRGSAPAGRTDRLQSGVTREDAIAALKGAGKKVTEANIAAVMAASK